jgi:2,4-diketo-3-deoxy-L-fuconate hydrolase
MEIPKEPVIVFKSTTSLLGPNDSLVIQRNAKKVDWEVELALVIGKRATYSLANKPSHTSLASPCTTIT